MEHFAVVGGEVATKIGLRKLSRWLVLQLEDGHDIWRGGFGACTANRAVMDRIPSQAKDKWGKRRQKRRGSILIPSQEGNAGKCRTRNDTAWSPIVLDDINGGGSGLRKSRRPV